MKTFLQFSAVFLVGYLAGAVSRYLSAKNKLERYKRKQRRKD